MKTFLAITKVVYHGLLLCLLAFAVLWLAAPTVAQTFTVASQEWDTANFCILTGCVSTGAHEFPDAGSVCTDATRAIQGDDDETYLSFIASGSGSMSVCHDDTADIQLTNTSPMNPDYDPLGEAGWIRSNYFGGLQGTPAYMLDNAGGYQMRFLKKSSTFPGLDSNKPEIHILTSSDTTADYYGNLILASHNPASLGYGRADIYCEEDDGADAGTVPDRCLVNFESDINVGEYKFFVSDVTTDQGTYWMQYDAANDDWEVHSSGGCLVELDLTDSPVDWNACD